jgi:hypothetical protein
MRRAFFLLVSGLIACTTVIDPATDDAGTGDDDGGATGDSSTANKDGGAHPSDAALGKDAPVGTGTPPFGGSSSGSGGTANVMGTGEVAGSINYRLIVPSTYVAGTPTPLLVVYSGTEGGMTMTNNLMSLGPSSGTDGFIRAVLDGVTYNGDGNAGATVLDDVRSKYDVDNDRTYLLGESAGTTAALKLGFHLRQSYFAAYWANDVNATDIPGVNAAALGFAPWGQAGPGGDLADAQSIVMAMMTAGYRVPSPAPYAGAGSTTHGDPNQFIAAITWFPGKTRK